MEYRVILNQPATNPWISKQCYAIRRFLCNYILVYIVYRAYMPSSALPVIS